MIKNILKGLGIFILVVLLALVAIPYLFEDKIKEMVVDTINKNLDATVSFSDIDLSLIRSFPQASVSVDSLKVINKAPFAGDTLVYLANLNLNMSIRELFKDKTEPMDIESVSSNGGVVNILFDKNGVGNFDIALKNAADKDSGKSDPMVFNVQDYKINNLRFQYYDAKSKIRMVIDSLDHSGKGDFSSNKLDLDTKSKAVVSLTVDKMNYIESVNLTLDALLHIDLEKSIYTFKQNKAMINELPLTFDGSIALLDEGQQYDLTFKTPTSSFKNFLGLIPSAYSGSLANVKTTGDFSVSGTANGIYSDTTVPKFNVAIASNNASFQYPDLPKAVQNIVIDSKIVNETGVLNDTYVNLDKLSFRIDQDIFNARANIRNITENPLIAANLKGTINLANVTKAYPVKLDKPLTGVLIADVETKFDMKSVEESQYDKMQNSGNMTLTGFQYVDESNKAININKAVLQFTNTTINLQEMFAMTGRTDMRVNGILQNFYGFMLKDQELKGNFTLKSNQFAVADFMTASTTDKQKTTTNSEAVKIPAFLNCTLAAEANTVLYDNLTLRDVSGRLTIKDQQVSLQNIKTSIFGGLITANGNVSTKGAVPVFDMNLGLNSVNIADTFTQLEMLEKIAPIAGVINGKLNSTIKLAGNLDNKAMTPNLKTLKGDMTAQLLSTTINEKNSPMVNKLDQTLKFIDLKQLNLNDLKAALTFDNGAVVVKPLNFNYKDIKVNVGGKHGFDQSMAYNVKFDVPAKYLGTEANKLLAQLGPADAAKIQNVPISAVLSGNFSNPKITTDMQQAVTNLATQLVKYQRDKLISQGTSALGNVLNNNKPKDTTAAAPPKEDIKTKAESILKGLLKKK